MKTPSRGFVLGKFMPLHAGHVYMIDVASKVVDELTVLVCTRDCEPINGDLRADWVRQSVAPNVRVQHLHRDVPQEPADHPDFWAIWTKILREFHPEPLDVVFGSEPYIITLAACVNAQPMFVDPDREIVPISASKIRNDPISQWAYIPGPVRPYYQKRVCLLGPESTGKSTYAKAMAEKLGTLYVPEYGRIYDMALKQGSDWSLDDFKQIAKGHWAIQRSISERAGPWVIEDTDMLQTLIWQAYLMGQPSVVSTDLIEHFVPADHYYVCSPDVAWFDDGTRYDQRDSTRRWFFETCIKLLQDRGLTYDIIDGSDHESRLHALWASLQKLGDLRQG